MRNEGKGHGGQGSVTKRERERERERERRFLEDGDFILVGIFRLVYCWLRLVAKKVKENTRNL